MTTPDMSTPDRRLAPIVWCIDEVQQWYSRPVDPATEAKSARCCRS
jgi:hypothetical protein